MRRSIPVVWGAAAVVVGLAGCGGGSTLVSSTGSSSTGPNPTASSSSGRSQTAVTNTTTRVVTDQAPKPPSPPAYPHLLRVALVLAADAVRSGRHLERESGGVDLPLTVGRRDAVVQAIGAPAEAALGHD